MSQLSLDLDISYGWCRLHLGQGAEEYSLKTHWLNDGLRSLVEAVLTVMSGNHSVSVRWPLELSGGHFIDFVLDPKDVLHIAISELEYGVGASSSDQIWSAVRGTTTWQASVPLGEFLSQFSTSLRRLRARRADVNGFIDEWRHSFPQSLYERIEAIASARYGYKAPTSTEL